MMDLFNYYDPRFRYKKLMQTYGQRTDTTTDTCESQNYPLVIKPEFATADKASNC